MSTRGPFRPNASLDDTNLNAFAHLVLRKLDVAPPLEHANRISEASEWLLSACLASDPFDADAVARDLTSRRISPTDIVDICIPNVARQSGQMWVDDTASFVQVTLVGARLHALCKLLDEEWEPRPRFSDCLSVMVATVPDEQHMLGSVVLTAQLRRMGHSVQLSSGVSQSEIISRIDRGQFDAVLLSCSGTDALATAGHVVAEIRRNIEKPPRLIVGGAIHESVGGDLKVAGADVTTSSIEVALKGLGTEPGRENLLVAQ